MSGKRRYRLTGFRRTEAHTLYELLVTLAIAAIVLSVGLPSFSRLIADQRLRAQIDPLFHAIHLARKISIARRQVATLCPSIDGEHCSGQYDWSPGWILFVNVDRDWPAERDDNEPLLRWHQGDKRVQVVANRRSFTLRATELRATNGTLVVCDRAKRTPNRGLVVSYTGRPRVALARSDGSAYRCPD